MLIGLTAPDRLRPAIRKILLSDANVISVLTYWEVAIKSGKGKLNIGPLQEWWKTALHQLNAAVLPLHSRHIQYLQSLPPIHADPFDRMLICQAIAEDLTLLSSDAHIARYASPSLRIIH